MSASNGEDGGGGKDTVACSFPDEEQSPAEASAAATVVTDELASSPSAPPSAPPPAPPPPTPSRSRARNPTPRPHLFSSLEAAHLHVHNQRTKQSSRDAESDTTTTHGRVGDESVAEDMTIMTSALGRSLTTSVQPSVAVPDSQHSPGLPEHVSGPTTLGFVTVALPAFEPIDWNNVPKPLNTSRTTSSTIDLSSKPQAASPTSPPYVSGSSVDRIIAHYEHPSSSAVDPPSAVHGSVSDVEHFSHQSGSESDGMSGSAPSQTHEHDKFPLRGNFLKAMHTTTPPPQMALPANPPCRPSVPSFRPDTPRPLKGGPIPCVVRSSVRRPLSVSDDSCCDEDLGGSSSQKRGHLDGDAQDNRARVFESMTISDAESRMAQLLPPPDRMHSAQRAKDNRHSLRSDSSSSPDEYFSEDTDDDPFKYDVFVRPSKERAVSACLRKVSGLQRESRASIYSQDGTPSKTFGHHYELFGQEISPEMQRSVDANLQMPSIRNGNVPRSPFNHSEIKYEDDEFYNPCAVQSRVAEGNPNEVKIPIHNNLVGGAQQKLADDPDEPRSMNQLAWEQLCRRREKQQAHRLTGNTDD